MFNGKVLTGEGKRILQLASSHCSGTSAVTLVIKPIVCKETLLLLQKATNWARETYIRVQVSISRWQEEQMRLCKPLWPPQVSLPDRLM